MLLALFPLQLVLFPGEEIPLHIFESRYKQLIIECRDEHITFGMPAVVNGGITSFGTEAELVKIIKIYPNGEMDIVIRGKRIFKISKFMKDVPEKLYSGGLIEWIEENDDADPTTQKKLIYTFEKLLKAFERESPVNDFESDTLSFRLAPYLGLSLNHKVDLLTTRSENRRQEKLIFFMEEILKDSPRRPNKNSTQAKYESIKNKYFSPN
jgi:hypothetical protein